MLTAIKGPTYTPSVTRHTGLMAFRGSLGDVGGRSKFTNARLGSTKGSELCRRLLIESVSWYRPVLKLNTKPLH